MSLLDLTKNLATASEETVRAFLQSLKDSKSMAAEDLQENVFKNYNEFVTISKEISKLESDMQTLRGLLDDLKTSSDNLVDDDDEFLLTAGMSIADTKFRPLLFGHREGGSENRANIIDTL